MVGASLVAAYEWTFVCGPNVMAAVNALPGTLMYRSGLVPRAIPILGLVAGPILLASVTGVTFGTHTLSSGVHVIAALPVLSCELSLGVYLVARASDPRPSRSEPAPPHRGAQPIPA